MGSSDDRDSHVRSHGNGSATAQHIPSTLNAKVLNMPTAVALISQESSVAVVPAIVGREDDSAHYETANTSTTANVSTLSTTYCSTGMQTMPPPNAKEFRKIYDREPTQDELVKKIGTAGIGRYGTGLRPYEVIIGTPFPITPISGTIAISESTAFQASEAAHIKKSLLRTKVRAAILARRQLGVAKAAGYDIWPETQDEKILHMEQYSTAIHLDDQGNATNVNIRGFSLPNICGKEINPTLLPCHQRQHNQTKKSEKKVTYNRSAGTEASASSSNARPPLALHFSPEEDNVIQKGSPFQHISTVGLSIPGIDPASVEYYGYITLVPEENVKQDTTKCTKPDRLHGPTAQLRDGGDTMVVFGEERFADQFIVHDLTEPRPTMAAPPSISVPTGPRKRRLHEREGVERAQDVLKRSKTEGSSMMDDLPCSQNKHKQEDIHQCDEMSRYLHASRRISIEGDTTSQEATGDKSSSIQGSCNDHRASRTKQSSRDRSRSPVDEDRSTHYSSVSRDQGASRKPYAEERRRTQTREVDRVPHSSRAPVSMRTAEEVHDIPVPGPKRKARDASYSSALLAQQNQSMAPAEILTESHVAEELAIAERDVQLQKEVEEAARQARETEDRRRQEQKIEEAQQLEKKRQLEESEIKRARNAKNRHKLDIEEKKRTQKVERRRQEEEEQDRQLRREQERAADRCKNKDFRRHENVMSSSSTPADEYTLAREAENRRRELASGLPSGGSARRNARERSPRHAKKEVERRAPEKKIEDNKVTKRRPERNARGELERYDPRKRFGGGR